MPAGRKRKPTALKLIDGSAAKDPQRINRDEPQPTDPLGDPPKPWRREERAIWRAESVFWLTAADRGVFVSYCEARADADRARKVCEREGFHIAGSRGTKVLHPMARFMVERERDDKPAGGLSLG